MMARGNVKIEVEVGPVMRTALDVLDLSAELVDAIPDYHPQKLELIERGKALIEMCQLLLRLRGEKR